MININEFKSSKQITCPDLASAFYKAEEIRTSGDQEKYTILIKNSTCAAYIKSKVSGFFFKAIGTTAEIHGNRAARDLDEKGEELSTWKTATVKILGSDNIFEGLSFYNDRKDPHKNGQLVALEILGDNNLFINCTLVSTQDTLFVGPLPDDLVTRYQGFLPDDERYFEGNATNYFDQCTIKGSVDFIFGAGRALFSKCNLVSVEDGREGPFYVVAPSHSLKDDCGYVFDHCSFTHEFESVKPVYLARPWRDFGKATFIDCTYDEHICEEGFINWDGTERTTTARFDEFPKQKNRCTWANRNNISKPTPAIINLIEDFNKCK